MGNTTEFALMDLRQASEWASRYAGKNVTISNITYLIQYGRIKTVGNNGTNLVDKKELINYYKSYNGKREISWKNQLGHDLNWALSFDNYENLPSRFDKVLCSYC